MPQQSIEKLKKGKGSLADRKSSSGQDFAKLLKKVRESLIIWFNVKKKMDLSLPCKYLISGQIYCIGKIFCFQNHTCKSIVLN